MLVARKSEFALVNFRDFAQAGLKVLSWLILNAAILDETSEMMFALCVLYPAKFVYIAVEVVGLCRFEGETLNLLHFGFEDIKPDAINSVL